MLRRNKHVFTCPDVIYLRNRHKKNMRISLTTQGLVLAGLLVWGWIIEQKTRPALHVVDEEVTTAP